MLSLPRAPRLPSVYCKELAFEAVRRAYGDDGGSVAACPKPLSTNSPNEDVVSDRADVVSLAALVGSRSSYITHWEPRDRGGPADLGAPRARMFVIGARPGLGSLEWTSERDAEGRRGVRRSVASQSQSLCSSGATRGAAHAEERVVSLGFFCLSLSNRI